MRVAIDGPAGSGKSTVARAVAAQRGLTFLDTGAMYRAVALKCLYTQVDVSDASLVAAQAQSARIEFQPLADGSPGVFLDGEDVTRAIRTAEVDASVSAVAAVPAVRDAMVARQRELARGRDVVAEGRDIGTVVFPDAEVKVFLTASAAARAHRRAAQRAGSDAATNPHVSVDATEEAAILHAIEKRDEADSTREAAPLKPAEDAVHIDSSDLTLDEVVSRVLALVDAAQGGTRSPAGHAPGAGAKPTSPRVGKPARDERGQAPMKLFGNTFADYHSHGMREYPLPSRVFYHLLVGVIGGLTKLVFRWKVEDSDKLVSAMREGGCVVLSNHCASIDPIFLMIHAWAHGLRLRPVYKSEFDDHKVLTWLFSRCGGLPVERGTADMKMLRACRAALRRGESILIFPEGTRVRSDDEQVETRGGFALIAQTGKAKVVPTAIVGTRNIKPMGAKLPRPTKVILRSADALAFANLGVRGRRAQLGAMEDRAMAEVWRLRNELRADHPGRL